MEQDCKNNIFIQSTSNDRSTDDVIQWILHLNSNSKIIPFFDEFLIKDINISFSNSKGVSVNLNNNNIINKLWYRRGELVYKYKKDFIANKMSNETYQAISIFLNEKIYNSSINSFSDNNKVKLLVLEKCIKLKILIPETILTNNYSDLNIFFSKKNKLITKSIENGTFNYQYEGNEISLSPVLKIITKEEFNEKSNVKEFLPSLFQEYIEKQFEIRTFYLNGIFKSMAIFSQQNEKTKTDFRNYDFETPNRNVPYKLPKELEKRLHRLMLDMDINSGSFDIIYTPKGDFYLLEVNPIGQFQWLSHNCNYFLERLIANELLKDGEDKTK